jgi:uncharacterized glyoxalase superfamily protein PhnB
MRCEARLAYADPSAALLFLTTAFGLRELTRKARPDGSLMAWLAFGHSMVMIGGSGPAHHQLSTPRLTGKPTAEINVSVDDIDRHFLRATAAGAVIVMPLEDTPWGLRQYRAVDPEGHGWHFMKPLRDVRDGKSTTEAMEPRLFYADERAALEFLDRALGLEERARVDNRDGSIMAWLGCGENSMMISRSDTPSGRHSPSETSGPSAMINLHVDDVDARYRRAVDQGARIGTALEDTSWGFRRFEAVDPEGHRWHVMQPLA